MSLADCLRDDLMSADYTVDSVMERLGEQAQAGLHRNSTMPARVALEGDRGRLATLIRLFPLAGTVSLREAFEALPVDLMTAAGLLAVDGDRVRALVDVRPYGFETPGGDWQGWVVSDHTPGLDHDRRPTRPDFVLGVSPASTTLAQLTIDSHVGSALDLGTGCGVQSLHLSTHADRIVATDINPRCLELARLTADLNQLDVDLRSGSLYEPVVGEKFDLIVTNPPYVMSPPSEAGRLVYREAGFSSDDLVRTLVQNATVHLNPYGSCQVLANWAITGRAWDDRLAEWAPPGADLWVIERERLDPFDYIELWLTDAGLAGHQSWDARYREWLAYFERWGVRGIGMGWITVVNAGRDQPDITVETWPHEVTQPVGPAIAAHQQGLDWATQPDAELLRCTWRLRHDVVQETFGLPGEADPQVIALRQGSGLKRAMMLDTALAGVLGACDGSMPLSLIIDVVAGLLETDPYQVRLEVLPRIREAIIDGFLQPGPTDPDWQPTDQHRSE